jgi:hypothetical protein
MSDTPANDIPPLLATLEEIARSTKVTLERIERRLDTIERRLDAIEDRFTRRFDMMVSDQRSDFRWVLGIMLGGFGALLGVMARGFHWL